MSSGWFPGLLSVVTGNKILVNVGDLDVLVVDDQAEQLGLAHRG